MEEQESLAFSAFRIENDLRNDETPETSRVSRNQPLETRGTQETQPQAQIQNKF